MQTSFGGWEKRESSNASPELPVSSFCAFCREVIGRDNDVKEVQKDASGYWKRRRDCFPRLVRRTTADRVAKLPKSLVSPKPEKTISNSVRYVRNYCKDDTLGASSSSSESSLSLYTTDTSDEDTSDEEQSLSTSTSTSSCSFPYDQPPEPVTLPSDHHSKYISFQQWFAKRRSLRNAFGVKADITRWLQNKKHRTPVEERVLVLAKQNKSGLEEVPTCKNKIFERLTAPRCIPIVSTKDVLNSLTEKAQPAKMSSHTPPPGLMSVLDVYLKDRRIRVSDLFRCVDSARSGNCSRKDFIYVLEQARVALTDSQMEELADSLAVQNNPDCVHYSQLVWAMKRNNEMTLFGRRSAPISEPTGKYGRTVSEESTRASCVRQEGPCGDMNGEHCGRIIELFRDNLLFSKGDTKKKVSSRARNVISAMKTTMQTDDGLAGQIQQLRLRDRIEYEATRDAVRRHRLPVSGRALRCGLINTADHPQSQIDVRRLPKTHMLSGYEEVGGGDAGKQIVLKHGPGSLDGDLDDLGAICSGDGSTGGYGSGISSSSWTGGLRTKLQSGSRQFYWPGSGYGHGPQSGRDSGDGSSRSLVTDGDELEMGDDEYEQREEEEGEEREEEEEEELGDGAAAGGAGSRSKDVYDRGTGDRRSTRTTSRTSKQFRHRSVHDGEWRRRQRELAEQEARMRAVYWPGRADNVRIYRTEGDRGGHPIFERIGQTWSNDDPRYAVGRYDALQRSCCHSNTQHHQQDGWNWRRTEQYSVVGTSAVYYCEPLFDLAQSVQHDYNG